MNNTTNEKVALGEPTIPDFLLLNAKKLGRRLKRHPVNLLLRQLHGVKADAADLVALFLHGHVKPILLFDGVALAFVVTSGVGLVGLLLGGVMESFADEHTARGASDGREGVAVGKLVTDVRATSSEGDISDGPGGGTTRKQGHDECRTPKQRIGSAAASAAVLRDWT